MTVETRYVVIRENREVKTFVNKKEADEYDKLLDTAEMLTSLLRSAPVELSEKQLEDMGLYLAFNKDSIFSAFQLKKPALKTK